MIHINQSGTSSVYLELTSVSTIQPVYYIFQFTNANGEEKIFYKPDTSTTPSNYNLFQIEESSVEDLNNGIVQLNPGQWIYKVYQSGTSSLSLTYSTPAYNGDAYITSGLVWVQPTEQSEVAYTPPSDVEKTYNPDGF
ncbi:MAG TPA: hypothetical protein VF868_15250 [Bacteroidia bacterium]|jgi:hypothetical protein